ncbi:MAG: phosphoglucosamine mutase, partial [Verrucomicrobiota bacterium]
ITASHNPAPDNGFKLFDNRGLKFTLKAEKEIETFIEAQGEPGDIADQACGYDYDGRNVYINTMKSQLHQHAIQGWKIVLDTANGATYQTSPEVLSHFGADLVIIGDQPDGSNINDGVGSENPKSLGQAVVREKAVMGIAHDGDGDRLVLCDEAGAVVDGDQLLGIIALHALRKGKLNKETLVTTVQSNYGLDKCLREAGGVVERVAVGDRNVLLKMLELEVNIGGENSGHIIFTDHAMAGDGLLAAIKVIEVMLETGKKLSVLRQQVSLFPQAQTNLMVAEKLPLEDCGHLQEAIMDIGRELAEHGRTLVRYSGTESKLRLLVEAEDPKAKDDSLKRLIKAAKRDLQVIK